ncbi:hypothetical protein KKD62_03540 [Patescibacteria group bacterium]|nr:hypothetical protein [Patescibacteria group bacterium]
MKLLIQLLILLLPSQLSKHFWPEFAFIYGRRIDYLAPTLYLSDILVLVILLVYFFKQKKSTLLTVSGGFSLVGIPFKLTFAGTVYCLLNIFLSLQPWLAFYGWLRILVLLGLFIVLKNYNYLLRAIRDMLPVALFYSSIIALVQFIKQASIGGWFYWLGERQLVLGLPGIARELVGTQVVLPAYATFSHPNSLAGFLLLGSLILAQINLSFLTLMVFVAALIALVITFSYTAFCGLCLALLFLILISWLKKPRQQKFFSY